MSEPPSLEPERPSSSGEPRRSASRGGGPVIVPRAAHPISRRNIDPDALKVLYRLQQFRYAGYLVGGSVRDLLLGRQPKDFDVGTDAHPYQIKKLFRNCWIIGRRFRLAHVRFGDKTIEVATFRRSIPAGTENEPAEPGPTRGSRARDPEPPQDAASQEIWIRHDNTFGTPEEDAFRRDFTINALFYDIATFSIIDYVGGLEDLRQGVIRSIGDPLERFQEDPVRMFRAVAFAARLGFRLDAPVVSAIRTYRHLIATASPARLIEEYYKVLRSGSAEKTFRLLAEHGLLEPITPELHHSASEDALWHGLEALDRYRQRFESVPENFTNSILLGTLLVPLGLMRRRKAADYADWKAADGNAADDADGNAADSADMENGLEKRESAASSSASSASSAASSSASSAARRRRRPPKEPPLRIGLLPVARRDTERLRQILAVQRRLMDLESSPRTKRLLMHRCPFQEALVWLEIHGRAPEALEHWRGFIEAAGPLSPHEAGPEGEGAEPGQRAPGRGRRRRRGRGRGRGGFNPKREP